MSTSVANAGTGKAVDVKFGADRLVANAKTYKSHARLIDAVASGMGGAEPKYESFDDAVSQLRTVWNVLLKQVSEGSEYTPSVELGFGSDNAGQIAEAIIGIRPTVGTTRKAFKKLGA